MGCFLFGSLCKMHLLVPHFFPKMVLGLHLSDVVFVKSISSLFLRKYSNFVLCDLRFTATWTYETTCMQNRGSSPTSRDATNDVPCYGNNHLKCLKHRQLQTQLRSKPTPMIATRRQWKFDMDEDFFSDDATLDALPEEELQALEDAAVRGTQSQIHPQQKPQQKHKQQLQYQQYQYYCPGRTSPSPLLPSQLPVGPPQQQQRVRYQQRLTEYQRLIPPGYQTLPTLPYTNRQQNHPVPLPTSLDNLPSSDDYGAFNETTELLDSVAPKAQVEEPTYMDGGNGDMEQVFGEYGAGQQYMGGGAVYNDSVLSGGGGEEMVGEEMVGIERDPDYYANQLLLRQQGLHQEAIDIKELKETIEKVYTLRRRLCLSPNYIQQLIISHNIATIRSRNPSAKPR